MTSQISAYVISEVEMKDAAAFEAYRTLAADTIAQYGGRYLVRGGTAELVDGGPPPKTIIVVEFSVDGTLARMVHFAGICRGAKASPARTGAPANFCRRRRDGAVGLPGI